jgi:metallo-beta-lactamase family protein
LKLSFHGADRGVTGSCHLIECGGRRVLIDCGFYQGGRELEEENTEPFGFDPAQIDFVLLSHAHLDHCGRLPLLVKRGFRGEIVTTAASRELCRLVMLDAAHLQEEEARRLARRSPHRYRRSTTQGPLYSLLDAFTVLDYFGRPVAFNQTVTLAPGIRATFFDAGHILGSASIFLELEERGCKRSVLFSGDIGNVGRPILRNPVTPPAANIVVMETTYGDRLHKPFVPSVEEFYGAVRDTFKRGGNVIIPTFALERAQEILYFLREAVEKGMLSRSLQIFLDSPMAISATEIFERHPECYEAQTASLFRQGRDPFYLPGLHFTRETSDSMAINQIEGRAIIMAGSGMCTGGRIRHHLRHNLGREDSSVIFVGFAAIGTLARNLIDGASNVRIYDEEIPVRAHIHTINGFSAHADQAELLAWHGRISGVEQTFLVHGEEQAMRQFAELLGKIRVEMPVLNEAFDI